MRRTVSCLLILALVLGACPVVLAADEVWDGTVDISWYDPAQSEFHLSTPAQLAGLAALVNGMADPACPNIIVEAVKPCEDSEKAFIVRMYEAEGTYTKCPVKFCKAEKIEITNMLEETKEELKDTEISFRPFEIKTFKVRY